VEHRGTPQFPERTVTLEHQPEATCWGVASRIKEKDKEVAMQLKKMHQEKQLDTLVDKGLGSKYDRIKLEEMVQVGLLCTQFFPGHRTKMSEVVRMLEGDGLAKRWEASQHTKESHKFKGARKGAACSSFTKVRKD
ncbi:hypothetical protein ACJX0J_036789, partial [Zea mays]